MGLLPAAIEWDKIAQLLWVAPLAGLAVAISYSLMIVGFARAGETRRDGGRSVTAMAYSALAVLSTIAFFGVVIFGVVIIIKK